MKKKAKKLNYIYYGSLEQFKAKFNGNNNSFITDGKNYEDLSVFINNDKIKIGLESGGHSGGAWYYLADINANEKEVHFSGTIDFIEYRERTRKEKNREMIGLIILAIILLPITMILFLITLVKKVIFKTDVNDKRRIDLLETFMVNYMECQSNSYNHHKRLPYRSYEEKIELLKYDGLSDETVHLYFSKDYMKRIEIYINNRGSYSYSIERLVVFDSEELYWATAYGYWDDINANNSYFENINSLIAEIKNELIYYEEDLQFKSYK